MQTEKSSADDTRALTRRLAAGEEEAWTTFHTLYYRRVIDWAARLLRNRSEAGEVAQAAFLRMLRGMKTFDRTEELERWMKCLIHCAYVDYVRAESRKSGLHQRYAEWAEMRKPDPVLEAMVAERYEGAVRGLDDDERKLLELSYFDRMSHREIGQQLEITAKAVERRLCRIRSKIRKENT